MENVVKIFDTTLRDGEQAPGCSMSEKDKLVILSSLEELGVDVIEAGFAASSNEDFKAVNEIAKQAKTSKIVTLSRCLKSDIDISFKALEPAKSKRLHLFIASSDIHLKYKLNKTRDEVKEAVKSSITYAKTMFDEIEFSCEDATRTDLNFLSELVNIAVESGATIINLPDTVGYSIPNEIFEMFTYVKEHLPKGKENIELSTHCHNDLGMATACSLAAVRAGATQIECTVCGIGERAGNAPLEEIVMAIKTRKDLYNAVTNIETKKLYRTAKQLSAIMGIPVPKNKAIIGANAFSHESGIHQHGVIQNRSTYEIMSPEDIGIPQSKMVLGKHSGRHALREWLDSMGYVMNDSDLDKAFVNFKNIAEKKKNITEQDIEAIIKNIDVNTRNKFEYVSFVINSGNTITSTANVKLKIENNEEKEKVATGDGPVDACFKAINKITKSDIKLLSYTLQSVTEGVDALGEVTVKIKADNDRIIIGRGLSKDIIEASIKAYLNAINKV